MKNCIKLQGTIIHIFTTKTTTIITLFVGNKNYPEIYCFGKIKEYVDKYIAENMNVNINCYIKNTKHESNNLIYYTQNIIALNILEIKSNFSKIFNIKETQFKDFKNEVYLYGTIEKIKSKQNGFIYFILKLKNTKHKTKLLIASPLMYENLIQSNNDICLYANIQTKIKEIDNKIKRYETIVIKDISLLRKEIKNEI